MGQQFCTLTQKSLIFKGFSLSQAKMLACKGIFAKSYMTQTMRQHGGRSPKICFANFFCVYYTTKLLSWSHVAQLTQIAAQLTQKSRLFRLFCCNNDYICSLSIITEQQNSSFSSKNWIMPSYFFTRDFTLFKPIP